MPDPKTKHTVKLPPNFTQRFYDKTQKITWKKHDNTGKQTTFP